MTLEAAFAAIEDIAAVPGKNIKESLVSKHLPNDTFRRVLTYALSPDMTFGVSKSTLEKAHEKAEEIRTEEEKNQNAGRLDLGDEHVWEILDQLANRKLTGNDAIYEMACIFVNSTEIVSALFGRIVLKDLRAGFSASTVNKAEPGTIVTFDCMLAHKYQDSRVKTFPQFVEPKLDGVRTIAFVSEMGAKFFSRSGKEFLNYGAIGDALVETLKEYYLSRALPSRPIAIDGEVVDSESFKSTVSTMRKKGVQAEGAVFNAFDVVPQSIFKDSEKKGSDKHGNYLDRRALLGKIISAVPSDRVNMISSYMVKSHSEIEYYYEIFQNNGLEGAIVKHPNGLYHRRRNHDWMKIKAEESVELLVVDYFEGEGKIAGSLGGLVGDFKGTEVRVGGGFSDALRQSLWDRLIKNKSDSAMGRLMEVAYHEVTPDGSLRHPRFVKFRDTQTGAFE